VSIGVIDPVVAGQLRSAFMDDLRSTNERRFDEWKDRSLYHKTIDGMAYLGRSQL
jgi:hypothetical protein